MFETHNVDQDSSRGGVGMEWMGLGLTEHDGCMD